MSAVTAKSIIVNLIKACGPVSPRTMRQELKEQWLGSPHRGFNVDDVIQRIVTDLIRSGEFEYQLIDNDHWIDVRHYEVDFDLPYSDSRTDR